MKQKKVDKDEVKRLRDRGMTCKHPILPEEIVKKRESLRTGQAIYVELRRENDDFKIEVSEQKCTIKEKYPHFCLVEDRKGRRECILYVDLLIKKRDIKAF